MLQYYQVHAACVVDKCGTASATPDQKGKWQYNNNYTQVNLLLKWDLLIMYSSYHGMIYTRLVMCLFSFEYTNIVKHNYIAAK